MIKFNCGIRACGICLLWATTAVALPAQEFKTLHNFDNTDGADPAASLVQATNGDLYGTTEGGFGGANNDGTIFKITPTGTLATLHTFNGTDGTTPTAPLIQATNGNLYGTAPYGGANNAGTIFKITPDGTFTTLYNFCSQSNCTDGVQPTAGLVQGTNGDFYGTTMFGGASGTLCSDQAGCGTIFKITPGGALTTIYSFCPQSGCTDGEYPSAGLVLGTDRNFYGTTSAGGAYSISYGTVFKITPNGKLTTLYSFRGTDGADPIAALVQGTDGDFYGTTLEGGANSLCSGACGTVFKITRRGMLRTLHNFCSLSDCADGASPYAGVVQGSDGNFYGTTCCGGPEGHGTAFTITPGGTLTTLHTFQLTSGDNPQAGLIQDTDGKFYGATVNGGADGYGTVFSLGLGLVPFVETQPVSGKVGAAVKILGKSLTSTTSVTFNGIAATFTVVSKSEITTTVPTGATTGFVEVVTSGGTLSSNVPFTVRP